MPACRQPRRPQQCVQGGTVPGVVPQHGPDEVRRPARDLRPGGTVHRELLPAHLPQLLPDASGEGRPPAEHHVGDDTERPDVASARVAVVPSLVVENLGRGEGHRPHVRLHAAGSEVAAQAPIDDLHVACPRIPVDEADVLQLQVPVGDAPAVGILQGTGHLRRDLRHEPLRDGAAVHEAIEQVAASAILHDEEHGLPLCVSLEEPADTRVVQVLHDFDLAQERLELVLFLLLRLTDVRGALVHLLYRDKPILEHSVFGQINLTITANAQLPTFDLVSPRHSNVHAFTHESTGVETHPPGAPVRALRRSRGKRRDHRRRAATAAGRVRVYPHRCMHCHRGGGALFGVLGHAPEQRQRGQAGPPRGRR
mmetsp:Transcript_71728/g.233201  ORF Transcript_71728/g.233201 Transcript_71728/m.233201 type:complete len:367 (-) Transcript_71728:228-1328(-)